MLRAAVHAHAMRASQNGLKNVCREEQEYFKPSLEWELFMKYILVPGYDLFFVCFCIEESTPLLCLMGNPSRKSPLRLNDARFLFTILTCV